MSLGSAVMSQCTRSRLPLRGLQPLEPPPLAPPTSSNTPNPSGEAPVQVSVPYHPTRKSAVSSGRMPQKARASRRRCPTTAGAASPGLAAPNSSPDWARVPEQHTYRPCRYHRPLRQPLESLQKPPHPSMIWSNQPFNMFPQRPTVRRANPSISCTWKPPSRGDDSVPREPTLNRRGPLELRRRAAIL